MSIINEEQNYIFVHVPKTAGTSMESILGGTGHTNLYELRKRVKSNFNDYLRIAFVRNPYDRFVSAYHYTIAAKNIPYSIDEEAGKIVEKYKHDMKQLIKKADLNKLCSLSFHFRPQNWFLCLGDSDGINRNGVVGVNFLGYFENIREDWTDLCDKLHKEPSLQHSRRTKRGPWQEYYDTESANIIYELYKRDFELFHYTPKGK